MERDPIYEEVEQALKELVEEGQILVVGTDNNGEPLYILSSKMN